MSRLSSARTRLGCATALSVVLASPQPASAQDLVTHEYVFRCGTAIHANEASGTIALPHDQSFCPLVADPKQPRSFLALLGGEFLTLDNVDDPASTTIGSVGLGDRFGFLRWGGSRPGDGFQLGLFGAVFAQFDLGTPSIDLINADYLVGFPLTYRRGGTTARLRLYHQSSHLGDEYVLRDEDIQRENLSFESLELILSQEQGALRAYAGGERLFRREPDSLEPMLGHAGVELHTGTGVFSAVVGLDVKFSEQQNWTPAWSARGGIRIAPTARAGHPSRRILLLAEYYSGPSPYGQFFHDDITYAGLGIHLVN
jgi:hypothetical protein